MKDFTVVWLAEANKKLRKFSAKGEGDKHPSSEEGETSPTTSTGGLEIKGAEPPASGGILGDWMLPIIGVMVLLLGLILCWYVYASFIRGTPPVHEENGMGAGGTDLPLAVQHWQKELELLREHVERLQREMADWAARGSKP